jgi:HEAT repeat protein
MPLTLPGLNVPAITGVCCALMLSAPFAQTSSEVEHVVEQMRGMSMTIQGAGRMTERERKRRAITKQLHDLGPSAIFALTRVLRDSDVQMRQNAALVLSSLGGGYEEELKPPLDTRAALPALIEALTDDDRDVRAWAAGAIGWMGPPAEPAIPALVKLLRDPYEGARNNGCIALEHIGPAAREALPVLREALNDPSRDVRRFAAVAIQRIEGK